MIEALAQRWLRHAALTDGVEQTCCNQGYFGTGVVRAPHQKVQGSVGGNSVNQHQHSGSSIDARLRRTDAVATLCDGQFDIVVVCFGDVDVKTGGFQVVRCRTRSSATQQHDVSTMSAGVENTNLPRSRRRGFGHFRHDTESVAAVGVVNVGKDRCGGRCHVLGGVSV
nr:MULTISPECIES: hypothetical protein [unclassified Rhodococcus (in: high G+C Gram-positive bacteria)]